MFKKIIITMITLGIILAPYSPDLSNYQRAVHAQTTVNYQTIDQNTIWTIANSPYLIYYDNLTINPGATLTIEPGVIVKLEQMSLIVKGGLIALGEEGSPVIFTSINDDARGDQSASWSTGNPASGDWGAIKTQASGAITLNHTIVNYGGQEYIPPMGKSDNIIKPNTAYAQSYYIDTGAITSYGGDIEINNSKIFNNIIGILSNTNNTAQIHNSEIYNNDQAGIINQSETAIDATNNWWGHATGPYHEILNPDGQGNSVSDYVIFDPWTGQETNQPPVIESFGQYKSDGETILEEKARTAGNSVVFKAVVSDPDGDAVRLQVEIREYPEFFQYFVGVNDDNFNILNSGLAATGAEITTSSYAPADGKYHWRIRAIDERGLASEWEHFGYGGVLNLDYDFEVGTAGHSSVIFLPGLQVSRLYAQGIIFENQLWEPNRNADVEKLFMDENGNSVNPDIYTRDVIDEINIINIFGFGGNIYKTFLENMNNMVSTGTINQFESFPYDWRMGIDDIVNGVVKTDTGGYSMIQAIESMASSSQTGRVTIIAHSMGGLVAKRLISRLTQLGKENLVDKFIMIATPQTGTPKAIASLLHGDGQDLLGGLLLNKPTAREFGENMPSSYSLLPSARYFENNEMPIIAFDASSSFLEDMRNYYGNTIVLSASLNNFLLGAEGRDDPLAKDVDTPNVLSAPLLNLAVDFHNFADVWSPPAGLEVIQIAGWGLDTISGIRYTERRVLVCPNNNYDNMSDCYYKSAYGREPIFNVNGDETVMLSSADAMSGVGTYYLDMSEYNDKNFINHKHASIMEVDSVLTLIDNTITGASTTPPEYICVNKDDLSRDDTRLRISVHSPVSLDIYDSDGRHTGLTENPNPESDLRLVEENIPNSYYLSFGEGKYTGVGGGDEYRIELRGLDYGVFTLNITVVSSSSETMISYQDIPVTPETKAELVLEDLDNKGSLEIDLDGDGEVDIEIDSPEDTLDPIQYIGIIRLYVKNMDMKECDYENKRKQRRCLFKNRIVKKYLLIKLRIIKKLIKKNKIHAAKKIINSLEKQIKKKAVKYIPAQEAKTLLEMIGNLRGLMI